jgi:hypothetical protein
VQLFDIVQYESAGMWVDSGGYPCLPIRGLFSDGQWDTQVLYSSNLRKSPKYVTRESQWVIRK